MSEGVGLVGRLGLAEFKLLAPGVPEEFVLLVFCEYVREPVVPAGYKAVALRALRAGETFLSFYGDVGVVGEYEGSKRVVRVILERVARPKKIVFTPILDARGEHVHRVVQPGEYMLSGRGDPMPWVASFPTNDAYLPYSRSEVEV